MSKRPHPKRDERRILRAILRMRAFCSLGGGRSGAVARTTALRRSELDRFRRARVA